MRAFRNSHIHYSDVIMSAMASQITSVTMVYSTVCSGAINQRKHQSSASLAFVWEIHRWPVNFPHKWPVTRKIFPFDDVIMLISATLVRLISVTNGEPRAWIHRSPVDSPPQRPVTRTFDVFFDLRLNNWTNSWAKNRDAGDLGHRNGN